MTSRMIKHVNACQYNCTMIRLLTQIGVTMYSVKNNTVPIPLVSLHETYLHQPYLVLKLTAHPQPTLYTHRVVYIPGQI